MTGLVLSINEIVINMTEFDFFFDQVSWSSSSDQRIVTFTANSNSNRFTEATSVRIGIGIVHEFQNLQIGIGIIFVRWEVFANNSQIPDIYFFSKKCLKISFS